MQRRGRVATGRDLHIRQVHGPAVLGGCSALGVGACFHSSLGDEGQSVLPHDAAIDLRLGHHNPQGMTIGKGSPIAEKVFISIGNTEIGSGMSYTAFSRAKTRSDYAVQFPIFGLSRLTRIKTHKKFQARIIEDARLEKLAKKTASKFRKLYPGPTYRATPYDPCSSFSHRRYEEYDPSMPLALH